MENQNENRYPNEVVEVYRHPRPQEIVLEYRRPRAESPAQPAAPAADKPRKRRGKGLVIFLILLGVTAVLAVLAVVLQPRQREPEPPKRDGFEWHYDFSYGEFPGGEITIPAYPTGMGAALEVTRDHGEELTVQDIYRQVNPSVVAVMAEIGHSASVGTGVIFTDDGYILTNYHVLDGGEACLVMLDNGYTCEAQFVAGDEENDIAILKVDEKGLPAAVFGDSDDLTVGDPAYAIGNPLGMELRGTLTDGIISAINRDVEVDGRTMTLLQTSAALNVGNSGGPLINRYGQVVGINVIKMSSSDSSIEGLGFAIPSAYLDRVVNDLLTFGEIKPEPRLGVTVLNEGFQLADSLWGLKVQEVAEGTAADAAGIRAGDYMVRAAGEELRHSNDLMRVRRHHYVGDEMPVTVWRDGELLDVKLKLNESVDE